MLLLFELKDSLDWHSQGEDGEQDWPDEVGALDGSLSVLSVPEDVLLCELSVLTEVQSIEQPCDMLDGSDALDV